MDLGFWDSSVITNSDEISWVDISKGYGAWSAGI